MTKHFTLREVTKGLKGPDEILAAGGTMMVSQPAAQIMLGRMPSLTLDAQAMRTVRKMAPVLSRGGKIVLAEKHFRHIAELNAGAMDDDEEEDGGTTTAMSDPVTVGLGIAIAVGFGVGFAIGWITGDTGEEPKESGTSIEATSENGNVTVTVGDGKEE